MIAACASFAFSASVEAEVFLASQSCGTVTAFDQRGDAFAQDDDPCGPGVWARVSVMDGPAFGEIVADVRDGFGVFVSGSPTASASGTVMSDFQVLRDIVGVASWDFMAGAGGIEISEVGSNQPLFTTSNFTGETGAFEISLVRGVDYRITMFAEQRPGDLDADSAFVSFAPIPAPAGSMLVGGLGLVVARRRR
ncbi:MAG: hypothetical protein CMJ31_12720 [Phycisphaerae bacterium]|nr:hypothetical protein [Phycisphaerae bacterium]